MYNVIGYRGDKVYTLQEDGTMCSVFNSKPKRYYFLNDAKKDVAKIENNRPYYNNVCVIDEKTREVINE